MGIIFNRNKNKITSSGSKLVTAKEYNALSNKDKFKGNYQVVDSTQKDTQGNYVPTTEKTSTLNIKTYNEPNWSDKTPSSSVTGGERVIPSGDVNKVINSRGGGSSRYTPATSTTPQTSQVNPRQDNALSNNQTSIRNNTSQRDLRNIKLNRSGSVSVDRHEYIGNAYIKDLGMTANEYNQKMREKLISEGQLDKRTGRGRYAVETQTGTDEQTEGEKIIYNAFGEIIKVESKAFGKTFNSLENYIKAIKEDKGNGEIAKGEKSVYGSMGEYTQNGKSYDSKGKELYSGEASGLNLRGAFPKASQVLDNSSLMGIGIPNTPLYFTIKKGKEKTKEYSGLFGGVTGATTEYIKKNVLGMKDTNISKAYYQGKAKGEFTSGVINKFIPETPREFIQTSAVVLGYGYLPTIAKIGVSGYFGYSGIKGALNKNLTPEERTASGIIGGLSLIGFGSEVSPAIPLIKGRIPRKSTLSLEEQKLIEPFTRQRATVILKDTSGNYLMGKTKTGETISFGGLANKGESFSKAGLRELREETGLTSKDILDYKPAGKVVTAEETFHLFTGTLKEGIELNPKSDIKKIVKINPSRTKNILGQEITGQSLFYPVTRRGVRSYELGILNYLERGTQPKVLSIKTSKGEYYLGTQSRYNIAGEIQKKYLNEENLLLAHGTQAPLILRRNPLFNIKEKIDATISQRGTDKGLYVQPPASPYKLPPSIFEESFLRRGKEVYLKERQPAGKGLLNNKAGTFIKFVKPEQKGYVGLSYLGFGSGTSESLGLKFGFAPKKTIITLREEPVLPIKQTKKSLSGQESELIIQPETYIQTTDKAKTFFIGGQKVFVQPAKILKGNEAIEINKLKNKLYEDISVNEKTSIIKKLKDKTGIDYSNSLGEYKYISPFDLAKSLKSNRNNLYSESKIKEDRKIKPLLEETNSKERTSIIKDNYFPNIKEKISIINNNYFPSVKERINYPSIKKRPVTIYEKEEGGNNNPILPIFPVKESLMRKAKRVLRNQGYDVGIIEKGKPKIIRKGLLLNDARDEGTKRILKDLRATFFIKKSNQPAKDIKTNKEFNTYRNLLRKPLVNSPYNKLGEEVYVQRKERVGRSGGRLTFGGEKAEIKRSPKNNNINFFKSSKKKKGGFNLW